MNLIFGGQIWKEYVNFLLGTLPSWTRGIYLKKFNEYPDEVPIKNFRLVPSYKRMCITILKNDTSCRYMGFFQTKDELQKKENFG